MNALARYFPILRWGRTYSGSKLSNDLLAAVIVTIMLVPQSLAYALLAGMPAQAGIYASIVPIILYAIFGTSSALAVGPVAVVSLMTATAIGQIAQQGTAGYAVAALTLAFLSGAILIGMGLFRLGFLANVLSHPVIAGFITASGILIAAGQLRQILGVPGGGSNLIEIVSSLFTNLPAANWITLIIGVSTMALLFWVRGSMKPFLLARGVGARPADVLTKAGPIVAVFVSTLAVWLLELADRGVRIVGELPQSLPPLTIPSLAPQIVADLFMPALLISIIGFVESISVAQTLAAKRRERIDPDQELIGLGAANVGAAFTGGFPVTGGFARSVVNFDAGAETPAAGAFTAIGLAFAAVALTPLIYFLPQATLAGTIIVAVLSLLDFSILSRTWAYSKSDFAGVVATIGGTLIFGVEAGVITGILLSILLRLAKTSRPHVAEVGLVPGSHHFRNINRHKVETDPAMLTLRVDESLYFVNARFIEDMIQDRVAKQAELRHVVLMCSAVNSIDFSALEALEEINLRLRDAGIALHMTEVKGPVMDKLKCTHFLKQLTGKVYLAQHDAWQELARSGTPIAPAGYSSAPIANPTPEQEPVND
jgi:SulP family sulfate permease